MMLSTCRTTGTTRTSKTKRAAIASPGKLRDCNSMIQFTATALCQQHSGMRTEMTTNIEPSLLADKPSQALLSVKEAAAYLNMSESWLYTSDIPFVRFGSRTRRYRRTELDQFVGQRISHGNQRRSE